MFDQDVARSINTLETRMDRIEALMQRLLYTMLTSQGNAEQIQQIQAILQELRGDPEGHVAPMYQPMVSPQERPEMAAIRQAVRAGKKIEAIKLYRSLYGVDLKEAKRVIDAM
jgi:ribosomal protein L7/L12